MEYYIFLIVSENETIIQKVNNHNTRDSIIEFMESNFGSNNFFIYKSDTWTTSFVQIVKGKVKQFGKNEYLDENPGLLYLYDNYNVLFNNPEIFDVVDKHNLDLIQIDFNQLIHDYGFKEVSINNWKYKLTASDMFITFNIDPTKNKKYINWLNKLKYIHGILDEDESKIKDLLTDFDKPEVKSLIKKAGYDLDINEYETDSHLFELLDEVYYSKLSQLGMKDTSKLIEARSIFQDNKWWVVVPENHNESVKLSRYGGMTYWCTAAQSEESQMYYHNYTVDSEGNSYKLYIFINKSDPSQKYQWSELEGDFLDWNDKEFNVNETFNLKFISEFDKIIKIPTEFEKILGNYDNDKYVTYYVKHLTIPEKIKLIKQNKYLDIFINDYHYHIKIALVRQGYGLDILVNDENDVVRCEVASHGYGLDVLINDEEYTVRREVVRQGYKLDILINDEDETVRCEVAKQGYGLDFLINDKDYIVRIEVAQQGYGLDILVHDENWLVRKIVVEKMYGLDILVHDENNTIRVLVARQGYGLDILINDENEDVRKAVAEQGYGLDILRNDTNWYVSTAAYKKSEELDQW